MNDFPYADLDRYLTDEDYGRRFPRPRKEDQDGYDPDDDRENREELREQESS
jgi:hypothetical protein